MWGKGILHESDHQTVTIQIQIKLQGSHNPTLFTLWEIKPSESGRGMPPKVRLLNNEGKVGLGLKSPDPQ